MAKFHKHDYQCHGNVKPRKSIKRRKHEKIPLCSLFLSHSFIIKG